jgi:hypothetical protein
MPAIPNSEVMPIFSFPESTLRFSYPATTPRGHSVEVKQTHNDNISRVHISSLDSREIYFELTHYVNLTPQDGYQQLKTDVEERMDECRVTPLTPTFLNGHKAFGFSFHWQDRERNVLLIEAEMALFRVVYDPESKLNEEILASMRME